MKVSFVRSSGIFNTFAICNLCCLILLVLPWKTCFVTGSSSDSSSSSSPNGAADEEKEGGATWYDCSEEIGISDTRMLTFTEVRSDPPVVIPSTRQKILKTILYTPLVESSEPSALERIHVGFHQYYKVFGRKWMTFLKLNGLDACREHENLCPLESGVSKEVITEHPPLNRLTPYGWYRSRQIYTDAITGVKIGCVDMAFQYCEAADKCKSNEDDSNNMSEDTLFNASVRRRQ